MRQRKRDAGDAATLPQIEMVQRAGADAHQGAAASGHGIGGLLVSKDFGSAVRVKANRFHVTAISDAAPSSSDATDGDTFSRSPMITVRRREGSMSAAATRMMSAAVSASTFGTNVVK